MNANNELLSSKKEELGRYETCRFQPPAAAATNVAIIIRSSAATDKGDA
jgi:hypothetical protein